MSRLLADLTGVDHQLFGLEMQQLEHATGLPGHDVRLTAELIGQVHLKTRQLGLDPRDTTGRELYGMLLSLTGLHDAFLAKKIGVEDPANAQAVLSHIHEALLKTDLPRKAWVLKPAVGKRLLKAHPPKKVMKYLGYKSLDSMLKREAVNELFVACHLLEDRTWLEKFMKGYERLTQMDFESRDIAIVLFDEQKWAKAAEAYIKTHRHIIMAVREFGVVALLPPPFKRRAGLTLTVMLHVLHQLNEVRLYTAFYKLHQMRPDLGKIMAQSLLHDEGSHLELGGQRFHWRVAQRHFGQADHHAEVLEPHLQAEDLSWRKAEEVLFRMEPALHFWHQTDYIGAMHDGRPLSFNVMDMALNYLNHVPYEQRLYGHLQDSIWNELFARYLSHSGLEAEALRQLDNEDMDLNELLMIDAVMEAA